MVDEILQGIHFNNCHSAGFEVLTGYAFFVISLYGNGNVLLGLAIFHIQFSNGMGMCC